MNKGITVAIIALMLIGSSAVIMVGAFARNAYLVQQVGCCYEDYNGDTSGCKQGQESCTSWQQYRTTSGSIKIAAGDFGDIEAGGDFDSWAGCAPEVAGAAPHDDAGCEGEERFWVTGSSDKAVGYTQIEISCVEKRETGNCFSAANTGMCTKTQVSEMTCGESWTGDDGEPSVIVKKKDVKGCPSS